MIAAALCLCLLFSSAANAYVMYTHDMGNQSGVISGVIEDSDKTVMQQHHNHSDSHDSPLADSSSSRDCCDDEEVCFSSSTTCAAHFSALATDVSQCLFQFKRSANLSSEFEQANPAFVSLAGPFKPPRK